MNGWNKEELDDVCTLIVDCPHSTPDWAEEGVFAIRSWNVRDGKLNFTKPSFVSEDTYNDRVRRAIPTSGDIVITREAPMGEVCIIPNGLKCCLGQRLVLIRGNNKKIDQRFLLFSLQSHYVQGQILSHEGSGSTVSNLRIEYLEKLKIPLPPLPIQRRIAEILGRYDALIDNYQKQISALENMAQELYREWFVRGRCPYAEPGEDGGLPVGWEAKTLGDVAKDARQPVKIQDLSPETTYIGLEHLSIKSIVIKDSGTIEDVDSDKLIFKEDDILFGKIRAYLHKVCLSHFSGVCSSDIIVIRPKIDNALGFVLFTVFDDHFIDFADKISNGTKMPRSEWNVLKTYKLIVPSADALEAFDKIAISVFKKIANLQTQLTTLRQTRDALLPRLLSGQLAVHSTADMI